MMHKKREQCGLMYLAPAIDPFEPPEQVHVLPLYALIMVPATSLPDGSYMLDHIHAEVVGQMVMN